MCALNLVESTVNATNCVGVACGTSVTIPHGALVRARSIIERAVEEASRQQSVNPPIRGIG